MSTRGYRLRLKCETPLDLTLRVPGTEHYLALRCRSIQEAMEAVLAETIRERFKDLGEVEIATMDFETDPDE